MFLRLVAALLSLASLEKLIQRDHLSHDGAAFASAAPDGTVQLLDTATGLPRGVPMHAGANTVEALGLSSDGKLLLTQRAFTDDKLGSQIEPRVWDIRVAHLVDRVESSISQQKISELSQVVPHAIELG